MKEEKLFSHSSSVLVSFSPRIGHSTIFAAQLHTGETAGVNKPSIPTKKKKFSSSWFRLVFASSPSSLHGGTRDRGRWMTRGSRDGGDNGRGLGFSKIPHLVGGYV